jgi:hypothetical protein
VDRCVLALINEGAKLLKRALPRASDIDVVYLNGYAFPRGAGGKMFVTGSEIACSPGWKSSRRATGQSYGVRRHC